MKWLWGQYEPDGVWPVSLSDGLMAQNNMGLRGKHRRLCSLGLKCTPCTHAMHSCLKICTCVHIAWIAAAQIKQRHRADGTEKGG